MSFYNQMDAVNKTAKTYTENGATAYAVSGKELLDFNFAIVALRQKTEAEIEEWFTRVFYEDKLVAIKFLFYVGDIRQGLGERKIFRACLAYLIENQVEIAKRVMTLVPEYNRWDSVLTYVGDPKTRKQAAAFLKSQLKADKRGCKNGEPITLCAKWMPSINASSDETKWYAHVLAREFGWSDAKYRKTLAKLRKYLDVVECKMSAKEWDKIDYESVPSMANLRHNNAFLRNDEERRRAYLSSLAKGEAKINASVANPSDIVSKYTKEGLWSTGVKCYDEALEQMWKALPDLGVKNTLVVRDGSGSMLIRLNNTQTRALDVATALAVYMAEHNTGEWRDKFVTFSANPKVISLENCKNLREKLEICYRNTECSNTDIFKTMRLILDTAVRNRVPVEEMPEMIVIISDMQFDGHYFNMNKSLFDNISDMYESEGYKLPKICFWNLCGRSTGTVPMQKNDMGLILCSGYSTQILRTFMSNEVDPYKILLETLNSDRYKPVEEAVIGVL